MPTSFSQLVQLCQRLEGTQKRKEKMRLLGDFLLSLHEGEIAPAVYLLLGTIFSTQDPRTLDVSWKSLQEVGAGVKPASTGSASDGLTVLEVHQIFSEVAKASGKGSRKEKGELLEKLFNRASREEARILRKIIFGEMRHGVGEGMMLKALSEAGDVDHQLVERAQMFTGDLGELARIALTQGGVGLVKISLHLFHPVQPMLAQLGEDFSSLIAEHQGKTALEYKLDGARVQIHKGGKEVRIFSRHLKEVTESIPEITTQIHKEIQAKEAIFDGEVIATNSQGKPLPFQELMRRFRRVHKVELSMKEVPVRLFLFDLLYMNGRSLIDLSYKERWKCLKEISPEDLLVPRIITGEISEAKSFLKEATISGHEGLMAKSLESPYTPGARGKRWFKIKPAETLDLVIVAADWGSGRREGWLSNYHLACRDSETGEYWVIGKTFKGLTDEEFIQMTKDLQNLKISETPYTVSVKPQIVVEIAYNEIQRSPKYESGFALRFARFTRIREDKTPREADTLTRLKDLYQRQFQYKGRIE
ncbi:ATP-dependent DNA ligase [candidate division TA06 bacterium]|nr:ATP-dependent DNA ligase [candidate division TA06 bacterium]